jgi:hypothetical protein
MPTCHVEFTPDEYYHLLDARLTGLVDTLLLNRYLESQDEFRWCKASKGCGAGQLVSNYRDLLGYIIFSKIISLFMNSSFFFIDTMHVMHVTNHYVFDIQSNGIQVIHVMNLMQNVFLILI